MLPAAASCDGQSLIRDNAKATRQPPGDGGGLVAHLELHRALRHRGGMSAHADHDETGKNDYRESLHRFHNGARELSTPPPWDAYRGGHNEQET